MTKQHQTISLPALGEDRESSLDVYAHGATVNLVTHDPDGDVTGVTISEATWRRIRLAVDGAFERGARIEANRQAIFELGESNDL